MRPAAKQLTSLDVYRDGGSLSVSFVGERDNEHTLFFKVKFPEHESETHGYFAPNLQEHVRVARTSPITGKTDRGWKTETRSMSWDEARAILRELEPQLEGLVTDYRWVYQAMVQATATEGLAS